MIVRESKMAIFHRFFKGGFFFLKLTNMEFFTELVTEAMDFLGAIDDLITEFEFPETWRETEGEEKKMEEMRKYNVVNEYF